MKNTNRAIINHGLFGDFCRYKLTSMISRFGNEVWFVSDAETLDDYDLPAIIRIADSREEAVKGLL
jgi:hypothetical protein